MASELAPFEERRISFLCIQGNKLIEVDKLKNQKTYRVIHLPEDFQQCKWSVPSVNASLLLSDGASGHAGYITTRIRHWEKDRYDSVRFFDIDDFELSQSPLPTLAPKRPLKRIIHESIGDTLIVVINASVYCPAKNRNRTYSFNYPAMIIGKCYEKSKPPKDLLLDREQKNY
jgi:hypothetical protein